MAINATNIVTLAKEHGWKITKRAVKETDRTGSKPWDADKSKTDSFDIPTHIITFSRGGLSAVMPVTPHAGMPENGDAYRYVRGNRKTGQMVGTDGKPVLLTELAKQLSAKPKTAKPKAEKKTADAS